nr:3-deoxy-manno-octulosonate cytidylyltransferase, mitochondrial [Tanacetum cinerariifolium]
MKSESSSSSSTASSSWPMKEVAAYGGAVAAAMAVGYAVMHGHRRISKFRKQVVGIIPARYASSRFQGKPLVPILGKPMIQRTWERAKLATTLSKLVVATDDERIANCCRGFGADVIMTSESCRNGTERCNEALQNLNKKFDIVVNIQGDEPLIEPEIIDGVVKALQASPDAVFSTAVTSLKAEDASDPNRVKCVVDNLVATDDERIANCCRGFGADVIMTSESCRNGTERCNEALQNLNKKFDIVVNIQGDEPLIEPEIIDGVVKALQASPDAVFSTAVTSLKAEDASDPNRVKWESSHLTSQSYDAKFLNLYPELSPTPLQLEEDLEQLKVLENGYKMKVIKVDHDAHGVDTPEDVEKIESLMRERNLS